MPEIERPDGAVIHYEASGSGFPLLLLAPGGVTSQIDRWENSAINPVERFSDEFMVIAMDQRHAGRSPAPLAPYSYATVAADQIAVLDAVGAGRALLYGGCIGSAHALRLIHDAPERIAGAVCQDPVGLDGTNSLAVFYAMFHDTMRLARAEGLAAVVAAAMENPLFVENNAAGPFSQRLHDDPAFRETFVKERREVYVGEIVLFRDGIWPPDSACFSVEESWLPSCPAPLLVLPGSDPFHPTAFGERLCREIPLARCLDADARSPAKLEPTVETIRAFLHEHAR